MAIRPFQGSIPAKGMKTSGWSAAARPIRSFGAPGTPETVSSSELQSTAIIRRAR